MGYEKLFNEVWIASFSLPLDDPKNDECKPLYYAEIFDGLGERVELFRIIPNSKRRDESTMEVSYECEHVLATLLDNSLFRYHQLTNYTTKQVIEYILSGQQENHWRLGTCSFTRYFHYSWENENILSALFSVPKPFDQQYEWTYDTTSYPWTLNLVQPEMTVSAEIRYRKNLVGIERYEDPTPIVTRIYPLGFGEGVNQLGIEKVNPTGLSYIEDATAITKYGIRDYIWVDRRFQDATLLYNSAKAKLNEWKTPQVTYSIDAVELKQITQNDIDNYRCGKVVRVVDEDFGTFEIRVVSENKSDCLREPYNVTLEIGSKLENLGTTNADLERRQQINEIYSQGATNQDTITYNDNCDPDDPALIKFYLTDDVVNINAMDLTYELSEFRTYGAATDSVPSQTQTSTSGGATVTSTSSGGQATVTSATGGQASVTSASGGGSQQTTNSQIFGLLQIQSEEPSSYTDIKFHRHQIKFTDQFDHSHSVSIPSHSHSVTLPSHNHSVTVPSHSHNVTIGDHSHEITIPAHGHDIVHGIYKLSDTPTRVTIKVDGNTVPITSTSGENIDITPYLSKDSEGKIERNRWINIEIFPNGLGRVNATVITRLFIQSRGTKKL